MMLPWAAVVLLAGAIPARGQDDPSGGAPAETSVEVPEPVGGDDGEAPPPPPEAKKTVEVRRLAPKPEAPPEPVGPARPDRKEGEEDPRRKRAIQSLVANLKDADETVREKAAADLGDFSPPAFEAVDPLIKGLKDKAYGVRYRAAESLERIGTVKARKAVSKFRRKQGRSKGW